MAQRKVSFKGGGRPKSIADLKKSTESRAGGAFIKRIKDDGLTVRFLDEPTEWYGYTEYYNQRLKSYVPMIEGESVEDPGNERPTERYLTAVVDIEADRVETLMLPKSLVGDLILHFEKRGTLLDRDYDLGKTGQGLETEYHCLPEDPAEFDTSDYEAPDLEDVLAEVRESSGIDDDGQPEDDDDDDGRPRRRVHR